MDIKILGEIGWDVNAIDVIEQIQSAEDDIVMYMFSGGGSAIHGFGIYDAMKASNKKITVKIFGFSASAASVIAMGADVIEMGEGALMMIHEASAGAWGTSEEMRDTAEVLDAFNSRLIQVYHTRTGIDKETLAEMINKNEWMSVDQAVELGFADTQLESFEVAASANLLLTKKEKEHSDMSEPKVEAKEPIKADEPKQDPVAQAVEPVAEVKEVQEVKAEESEEKSFFAHCANFFKKKEDEPKAEVVEPVAEVKEEAKADKRDLKVFMAKFGDAEGAKMFADDFSYEAAQEKHIENLNSKIEELENKLSEKSTIIEASKKELGGEVLALGATEPKAQGGRKIRFAD